MSEKMILPTDAMVDETANAMCLASTEKPLSLYSGSVKRTYRTRASVTLHAVLNHPDARGLFECDHTDYVHVDEAATRVEAAREQGWDDAAQHIYNKGWEGVAALRKANPHRPEREGAPTMSTPTEPNMQIIENATRKDVRPGDHVVFRHTWKRDGLAVAARREGIAHHLDDGNWCTEAGMYITLGVGEDVTITIRRPVQELPTKPGAVIVPDSLHEYITATVGGVTYHAREAILLGRDDWHAAWRSDEGVMVYVIAEWIDPGTWKADDQ